MRRAGPSVFTCIMRLKPSSVKRRFSLDTSVRILAATRSAEAVLAHAKDLIGGDARENGQIRRGSSPPLESHGTSTH